MQDVQLVYEVKGCDFTGAEFVRRVTSHGLPVCEEFHWLTAGGNIETLRGLRPVIAVKNQTAGDTLLTGDDIVVQLSISDDRLYVRVAGSLAAIERTISEIRRQFPEKEPTHEEVLWRFWRWREHFGALDTHRLLEVTSWSRIAPNYARQTRDKLGRLMGGFEPPLGGQLILLHGPPGTGKTWALRALSLEWRDWCDFHYVIDPERFFGDSDYLVSVLLRDDTGIDRWMALVLEDTGELLSADAKERTGQGLSRLLNMSDGLLGQGLRTLLLVTTNEELGGLHPAVRRPGRSLAKVDFQPFGEAEARDWFMRMHGTDPGPHCPRHLAEMFAAVHGIEDEPARRIGFAS